MTSSTRQFPVRVMVSCDLTIRRSGVLSVAETRSVGLRKPQCGPALRRTQGLFSCCYHGYSHRHACSLLCLSGVVTHFRCRPLSTRQAKSGFQSYHNLSSLILHPLLVFHTLIFQFAHNASTTHIYVEAPRIFR